MKYWRWGIAIVLALLTIVLAGYGWDNYQNFDRAKTLIEQLPTTEERDQTWREFEGPEPRQIYGGILAGTMLNRVWIWSREGLRVFDVDENSIYSWFDGCNDRVRAQLDAGVAGAIVRVLLTDFAQWSERAKVGDYVRIYVVPSETNGSWKLREIYTYNFWLFLRAGMEERCAK